MALSKIVSSSLANGSVSIASITDNTVTSVKLTATGVVANSYGNTTAIPVITVDAQGRITNATTSSVSGVTGLSYTAANSTVTVSTSTTNFDAVVTSGNSTVQGLLTVIDSVSNTSTAIAASANSVTTAYQLAANAVSNATAYAATAYSNAVATAASDATTKAGTAYSNATSYANTAAGTAYSNAISYANTIAYTAADTAYANAVTYANTKANAAYSNVFNGGTFSGAVIVQANLTANSVRLNGDLQIDGNLTVSGNTVSIQVSNLSVEDNMIYLNSNSTVSHPDLGFAGNYNDGSYAHAGLFRDATDGVWKFFHGYTPEPDASAFIDTANASFTLSNLQINYVIGNVTGSANSATYLGGNTAATLRSYSDTMAGTAYSNATTYAATIAGTAYSNAVSVAASDATTKAGTAYSNATTYAATIAGTAYSNAVAYAASNSYVNSTFLKLTGGSLTGNVATSAYIHANGTGGATGGYFGMVKIGYGASYGTVERTDGDLYLQYNNAYNVVAGYGGGYLTATNSSRAPIFYDSNNTAYYVDPASASNIGSWTSTSVTNVQTGTGGFVYQQITNTDAAGTYAYLQLTTSGAGSGYLIKNRTTGNSMTNQSLYLWNDPGPIEFVPMGNTAIRTTISTGGSMTVATDVRSPIFYDSNNTGYYTDPASTSILNVIQAVGTVWVGYHGGTAYNGGAVSGLYFGGDTSGAYRLWTSFENINGNYTKLNIDWHTGIKIGAYYNYGGIRFYDDAIGYGATNGRGNKCFSVAEGDTNVRAYYDMRSPIYYDLDNTGYYVNPASTSNLNEAQLMNGKWYTTSNGSGSSAEVYVRPDNNTTYMWRHIYGGTGTGFGTGVGGYGIYCNHLGADYSLIFSPSGFVTAPYSYRSPLFYDSNDTGYYLDPNTTSDSALRIRGGALHGPNVTWSTYLLVGGDGRQNYINNTNTASVCSTNGNLHMDAASGFDMFLNYYDGANIQLGNGALGIIGVISAAGNLTMNGNITAYSDRKLKTNIKTIKNAIDIVSRLRGVYFDWIESGQQSIGLIAQEAQEVVPELILENIVKNPPSFPGEEMPEDRVLSVDYGKITSILIEAIKEQQKLIETLAEKVKVLESR